MWPLERIEHTILDPLAGKERMLEGVRTVHEGGLAALVVPPRWVNLVKGRGVRVVTVVSFPFGFDTLKQKRKAVDAYLRRGADAVDVVVDLSNVASGNWAALREEVKTLSELARVLGKEIRFIVEVPLFSEDTIFAVAEAILDGGGEWLKTSTGRVKVPPDPQLVRDLKEKFPSLKVKASGGIRTISQVEELVRSGAELIGTSAGENLVKEFSSRIL